MCCSCLVCAQEIKDYSTLGTHGHFDGHYIFYLFIFGFQSFIYSFLYSVPKCPIKIEYNNQIKKRNMVSIDTTVKG